MSTDDARRCNRCRYEPSKINVPDDPFEAAFAVWSCPRCQAENEIGSERADLKFSLLEQLPRSYSASLSLGMDIQPVHDAFKINMDRVVALGQLPRMFKLKEENARRSEYIQGHGSHTAITAPVSMQWDPWPVQAVQLEPRPFNVDALFSTIPDGLRIAIDGLMGTMITGAWTAFETLAGDLWRRTVNYHPEILAELKGVPGSWKIQKDGGEQGQPNEAGQKLIKLEVLKGFKYDTLHQMGSVLIAGKRVGFTSLREIRASYAKAFQVKYESIKDAVMDDSLQWISGVRNVLVHKGGKADDDFEMQCSTCPHFAKMMRGKDKPIHLDGSIIADLLNGTTTQSLSLLSAVNQWLVDNP